MDGPAKPGPPLSWVVRRRRASRRAVARHRGDVRGRGRVLRHRPRPSDGPRVRRVLHHRPPAGVRHRRPDVAWHRVGHHRNVVGRAAARCPAGRGRPRRVAAQAVGRHAGPAGCLSARGHGGIRPGRRRHRMAAGVQRGGVPGRPDRPRAAGRPPCAVPRGPVGALGQLPRRAGRRYRGHGAGVALSRPGRHSPRRRTRRCSRPGPHYGSSRHNVSPAAQAGELYRSAAQGEVCRLGPPKPRGQLSWRPRRRLFE